MLTSKLPNDVKTFIKLLSNLSDKDKKLLVDRFINDKPMKEVAKDYNISDSRVKQIEDKLIKQIQLAYDLNHLI